MQENIDRDLSTEAGDQKYSFADISTTSSLICSRAYDYVNVYWRHEKNVYNILNSINALCFYEQSVGAILYSSNIIVSPGLIVGLPPAAVTNFDVQKSRVTANVSFTIAILIYRRLDRNKEFYSFFEFYSFALNFVLFSLFL
jgi:hypothetical protein